MPEPPLRDTFGNFLVEIGKNNKKIVVLDADLSSSTRTYKFAESFPDRFFNMGIAEQNTLGAALGFAISEKIPIVSGFSIFITGRAWELIRMACHDNLNLKIITTHGGIVGPDGSTHNALEDFSLMSSLPNMTVLAPSDNIELVQLLHYAINTSGPFYIRLPRGSFPKIHNRDYRFEIGKPNVLKQGNDICLIGTGYGSILAFQSANEIEKELNVSIKVINLPTIKPINKDQLLGEVKNFKGIIIIEEHNNYCGIGSIIARIISESHPTLMKFIGIDNSFGESGERQILLKKHGLTIENIVKYIKEILKK